MSGDKRIQEIKIDEYCPSRCGQPYMGSVRTEDGREYCLEVKFNVPYDVAGGRFMLFDYFPENPVRGVPMVGKGYGRNPEICREVECHFKGLFEKQKEQFANFCTWFLLSTILAKENGAEPTASQPQSSLEPCLAQ